MNILFAVIFLAVNGFYDSIAYTRNFLIGISWVFGIVKRELIQAVVKILVLASKPLTTGTQLCLDGEVHLVVCHRDIFLAINCIRSFYKESQLNIPLYIHTDATITFIDIFFLHTYIPFAHIIFKTEADHRVKKKLARYPYSQKLRKGWQGLKLIDIALLATSSKIIILDADLFFFHYPKEIIRWLLSSEKNNYYMKDYKHFSELSFVEYKKIEIDRLKMYFNTGLLCLHKRDYNLSLIEKTLSYIQKILYERIRYDDESWEIENRHLVEQTAFLALFSTIPNQPFSFSYVTFPSIRHSHTWENYMQYTCIHYTGEMPRHTIYKTIFYHNQPYLYKTLQKLMGEKGNL